LAFRRDEQSRLPAFDVHEVDFQSLAWRRSLGHPRQRKDRAAEKHDSRYENEKKLPAAFREYADLEYSRHLCAPGSGVVFRLLR
jgi:hypothetical protein